MYVCLLPSKWSEEEVLSLENKQAKKDVNLIKTLITYDMYVCICDVVNEVSLYSTTCSTYRQVENEYICIVSHSFVEADH